MGCHAVHQAEIWRHQLLSTACFLNDRPPGPYVLCLLQKELKKQYFRDPVLYEVNDEPVSGLICWSASCAVAHAASGCVCNITGSNRLASECHMSCVILAFQAQLQTMRMVLDVVGG